MPNTTPKRILLVDDYVGIHDDIKRLYPSTSIDSAFQGEQALAFIENSLKNHTPYPIAMVDIHLPAPLDGLTIIQKMWEIDPAIQVIITTVQDDYSFNDIEQTLNNKGHYVVIKKPFYMPLLRSTMSVLMAKWDQDRLISEQAKALDKLNHHQTDVQMQSSVALQRVTDDVEKSSALTQALLESTSEAIVIVGLDNHVLTYNKLFQTWWGINESELKNQSINAIFSAVAKKFQQATLFLKSLHQLIDNENLPIEKNWQSSNGKLYELSATPQYFHDERIGTIIHFKDVTEQRALEMRYQYLSKHDKLTGLLNSNELVEQIQLAINKAAENHLAVGVLVFDVDHFKRINECMSHKAGDDVLIEYAARLKKLIKEGDCLARLSADEFVAVITNTPGEENFVKLANQFMQVLDKPYHINNHTIVVTSSIGISMYPHHGYDVSSLLKNADAAVFAAKNEGRNNVKVYRREFNESLLQRMDLESALHHAIDRKELLIYYQPIKDLKKNKILCVEALLRWRHPTLGVLSSQQFIRVAEETGLIIPIGQWAIKQACLQMKAWQEKGIPPVHVALNISNQQFKHSQFIESLEDIFCSTQFDSSLLELEMTESMLLGDASVIAKTMTELKNMGVHLVLDDFGVGYASLGYLRQFPFEKIKIDRKLIQKISENADEAAVIKAVIGLAKELNFEVVAKGVETYAQLEFLRQHASDQIQGYIVQKPESERTCFKLLQENLLNV